MKNSNPSKSLITVILAAGLLLACVCVFSFSNTASILEKNGLKFTSTQDLYDAYLKTPEGPKKRAPKTQITDKKKYDSLSVAEKKALDTLRAAVNFLENFEIAADNTALSLFFGAALNHTDTAIHIWYYGDSQIEGDRITQDLRTLMQADMGGSGLGYVPFSDVASYRTIELKPAPGWLKLNCFTNKSPKGFGFAGKVFKFNVSDSTLSASTSIWISPNQKYQSLWLLYGKSNGGKIKLRSKDSSGRQIIMPAATASGKVLISSKPLYGSITLDLPSGTPYFGYLMEGNKGIQVDNCGIRGHSGDGLKFIADNMLQTQARQLNTKLVIFHFGNNMIPYIKSNKNMDYFRKGFEETFRRYKKLIPNASFLVISPGDMGYVSNGQETSYPFIADLVETFREAAKNTGCAFFDMHALMLKNGGIIGWKKKGLANLDGHLSASGQMVFARALYNELKKEMQVEHILSNTQ